MRRSAFTTTGLCIREAASHRFHRVGRVVARIPLLRGDAPSLTRTEEREYTPCATCHVGQSCGLEPNGNPRSPR